MKIEVKLSQCVNFFKSKVYFTTPHRSPAKPNSPSLVAELETDYVLALDKGWNSHSSSKGLDFG